MKKLIPINDNWIISDEFTPAVFDAGYDFSANFKSVSLPSDASLLFGAAKDKSYCYIKMLHVPKEYTESRIVLRFEGVVSYCEIYVNGIFVASNRGEAPFCADITAPVKCGEENLIAVKVEAQWRKDIPSSAASQMFAGIHREVYLEIVKGEYIDSVYIKTPKGAGREKSVEIDAILGDYYPDTRIEVSVSDGSGREIKSFPAVSVLRTVETVKGFIENAEPWSTENPVLYTAKTRLFKGDRLLDCCETVFGFRTAEWKKTGFYLNGKKVRLIGLNRYDEFSDTGRAATPDLEAEDVRILKDELGVNVVRTRGIPSRKFIEECDRRGLTVISSIYAEPYIGKTTWRETLIGLVEKQVLRDRNSPSVIAWGTRVPHSRDADEVFFKTQKAAKELDPSRATVGSRGFMTSSLYEDVYGFEDYREKKGIRGKCLTRRNGTAALFVPYLVTEHTGRMFPSRTGSNKNTQLAAALHHLKVLSEAMGAGNLSGVIGEAFTDARAALGKGSVNGLNNYGVMSIDREFKLSAYAYKSELTQNVVMEPSSQLYRGDFTGKLYVFTNCDKVRLLRGGVAIGEFYPDKKHFKNLSHPPVIIDDFIGTALLREGLKNSGSRLFKMFIKHSKNRDLNGMPFYYRAAAFIIRKRLKLDKQEFATLYEKYSLSCGMFPQEEFGIEGVIGGEPVIEKPLRGGGEFNLKVSLSEKRIVRGACCRTIRVEVTSLSANGVINEWDSSPVLIETDGALEPVGSTNKALIKGRTVFYLRTVQEGKAVIKIRCKDIETVREATVIYENNESV